MWLRPFARTGLAFAGLMLWTLVSVAIYDLIPRAPFLRAAVSGFLALVVLLPLWKLVPLTSGRRGIFATRTAVITTVVLFLPFVVEAFIIGIAPGNADWTWLLFAGALLLLAATEEVVCRGFLLDVLSIGGSRITGLFLSSCVFAYLHADNNFASIPGVLNILLAGMVFGLLRFVTGGLIYPTLLHWLWNLVTGMVFGWSVSGFTIFPTIFVPAGPLPWGGFGPEESLLMTVSTLGCIAILIWVLRSSEKNDLPGVRVVS